MYFAPHKHALFLGYIHRNGISGYRKYANSVCLESDIVFSREVVPVYFHTSTAGPHVLVLPNSCYFSLLNEWVYSDVSP